MLSPDYSCPLPSAYVIEPTNVCTLYGPKQHAGSICETVECSLAQKRLNENYDLGFNQ